jgi:signal transduction histidine kinase
MQTVVEGLQASRIPGYTLFALMVATGFVLLAGLILLRYLTRRLNSLAHNMQSFEASGFNAPLPETAANAASDQIGRLQQTFFAMAQRIHAQIHALQQTDDLRRELVANVSHDLRTPLAALLGFIETLLIKDGALDAGERRNFLKRSLRQGQSLGKLIDSLFELAKLETGQVQVCRERFALSDLIQDVGHKYSLLAQRKGVRVDALVPEQLPLVEADIGLIERVLDNLIDNALRNTPAEGRIDLRLLVQGGKVSVSITDTGPGIASHDLPYIFDRYYKSRDGDACTHGSAGLGLAICKRILELHESSIHVSNVPGAGARVEFSLPFSGPWPPESRAA